MQMGLSHREPIPETGTGVTLPSGRAKKRHGDDLSSV